MREHQIVVNLKAEQFEQLQRLARERGFKSVTAYVKQKLMELAIGLDETQPGGASVTGLGSKSDSPDSSLLEDLERIHNELKSFIGEISEFTDEDSRAGSQTTADMAQSAGLTAVLGPTAASQPPARQAMSFDVDPPDEDIDWDTLAGQVDLPEAPPVNMTGVSYDDPPPSSQVLPSRNLGGFGFGMGSRYSNFTPGSFLGGSSLGEYREIMDDMEELADRAFAISPRLGALDEEAESGGTDRGAASGRNASSDRSRSSGGSGLDRSAAPNRSTSGDISSLADGSATNADAASGGDGASAQSMYELSINTSFVEPISPERLAGPDVASSSSARAVSPSSETGSEAYSDGLAELMDDDEMFMAGSEGGFAAPLPPPPEEETIPAKPSYMPPPAPMPVREKLGAELKADESQLIEAVESTTPPVEDDLLSELLDESLIALAKAPVDEKEAFKPVNAAESFLQPTAGEAETGDISEIRSEEEATAPQVDTSGGHSEPMAGAPDQEQAPPDDSGKSHTTAAGAGSEGEQASQSQSGNSGAQGSQEEKSSRPVTQDANSMGVSSFSGSPPPKRRRT